MKFKDFSPEIVNSALLDACRTRKKIENRQMEHNIPNIPRELGSAYPIYIDGNFRGAVSILLSLIHISTSTSFLVIRPVI